MRNILFKGYSEALERWVFGYYFKDDANKSWILNKEGFKYFIENEKTICQCTGSKDIDGEFIFEGDIVMCHDEKVREIWFSKDESSFKASCINPKNYYEPLYMNEESFKIIGNKFNYSK